MASILIHTADESVTLTAQTVKRLLDQGDGDAALLYLALLRHHGTVQPRSLAGELRWEKSRIEAAEQALRDLRLLAPAAEEIPEPADEKPSYQRDDIARRLESSEEFRLLTAEVEKKLGSDESACGFADVLARRFHLKPQPKSKLARAIELTAPHE